MLRKILTIIYFLIVLAVAVFALAVGSSNGQIVSFNIQFVTVDLSVAAVSGFSLLFGAIFISLIWFYIILKQIIIIIRLSGSLHIKVNEVEKLKNNSIELKD
jgi:uncharacterized membrane protein YciS (DUF1049 family)